MPGLQHVVLLDKIDLSARDILAQNGIKADVLEKFSEIPAETLQSLDGLIVRSATKVTAEVISKCPGLKIIGRAGTGVDNIDVGEATNRGIIVMNTPGGNTISAAEHTCFMVVALARNAANNNAIMKSHKWSKGAGQELMGKTLGIIGLGRIGLEVASRMQAFGMKTVGFDPIVAPESVAPLNVQWMTLDELWPICDYITVHTPLIPQTKDLVCSKTLALCKKGVKIINVARGGIVSETDLLENLNSGQCGGAGLDVFIDEPVKDWTLVDHPNVVATAHLGASTKEGQLKCGQEIANQFVDFATNASSINGVINSPALIASFSTENAPWLRLATSLAQLLSASTSETLVGDWKVEITGTEYPGNLKRFILTAVAAGVLKKVESNANLINSSGLAEKHGLKLSFAEDLTQGDVQPQLKITAFGKSISGVVMNSKPYLKTINDAVFTELFDLEVSSGRLFAGTLNTSDVASVLTSLQKIGLQRMNLATVGEKSTLVGVSQKSDDSLNKFGIFFAA
ncbi:D-3-phosphoglycerate dehydrogenase-like [Symsagittifera roscoffensis]|uniref:D-3-phosphoglycerate dehydrogenase-like n=1 Tax=Symsagittifera roscoffensis TaxID=84072 RepID=UPI00307C583D